jgi:hypothetical protein
MRVHLLCVLGLVACGKKNDAAALAPDAPLPVPTTTAVSTEPPPTPPTAAGAEVKEPPKVTECPKSLGGAETVHRTITKDCGRVTVTDDYYVDGGSLTLEAGSVLQFKADTSISVGYNAPGKLVVKGTAEAPVLFTSGADAAAGVWEGVYLRDGADRSSIEGLVVEYAGQEASQAVLVEAEDVVWKGSTIRDSKGGGMAVRGTGRIKDFTGNVFDRTAAAPLAVEPEAVAAVASDNKFPKDSMIEVTAGTIDQAVSWNPGAPLHVTGQVLVENEKVKASLAIAAGTQVRFGSEGKIVVGYNNAGSLSAIGTKDAPIVFTTSGPKERGSWAPLAIFEKGDAAFEGCLFEYGGTEEKGALVSGGKLSVKGCTFRENAAGVQLTDSGTLLAFEGNTFEKNAAYAASVFPGDLGAFGSNSYDAKSRIRVAGGAVKETTTWKAQAAPVELTEAIVVEGKNVLTVEAGGQFEVRDGVDFTVGYNDAGSLRLLGTADKPIVFAGVRHEPGAWKGIILAENSRDSVVEHVVVKDAVKGVDLRGPSTAKVASLTCANCSEAALVYTCDAKVTAAGVKADGAAKGELKPDCPK